MKLGFILVLVTFSICSFGQKEMYYEIGATHVSINEVMPFYAFSSGEEKDYSSTSNVSLGLGVSVPVLSRHTILIGINYNRLNCSVKSGEVLGYMLYEQIQLLEVPANFRFSPFEGKWRPYVQAGIKYARLLNTKMHGARSGGTSINFSDDMTSLRNQHLFYAGFGGGVMLEMKKSKVYLDWRYNLGLNIFNNPEKRYNNAVLNGDLLYVDSDMKLNHSVLTVGIIPKARRK